MTGCIYKLPDGRCDKPGLGISYCIGEACTHKTPSNYDQIISMTPEEMADWLCKILTYCSNRHCDPDCPLFKCCHDQPTDNIEGWLKSPAKEGEG